MVDFTRQRQFKTREAFLPVDKGLPPGIHIFQLVVADQSGNKSKAAQVKVEILGIRLPVPSVVPVIPVVPVRGLRSATPDTVVVPVPAVLPAKPKRPGRRPKPK